MAILPNPGHHRRAVAALIGFWLIAALVLAPATYAASLSLTTPYPSVSVAAGTKVNFDITVKGNAAQWVIFAYPAGAMMMTRPAPGKRLQFFLGAHQVPEQFLNAAGLKLLGAAIEWSIQ